MNTWKEIPWQTKIYLAVLAILILVFLILIIAHSDQVSLKGSSLLDWLQREKSTANPENISAVTTTPTSFVEPGTPMVVALKNVDIRSGPNTDSVSIGILETGQTAEVLGLSSDNRWWVVKVADAESGKGWVAANQVRVDNPEGVSIPAVQVDVSAEQTAQAEKPVVSAIANVFIRDGPGTYYNQIGMLANGQTAEVVGVSQDNYWWAIIIPATGNQGWVAADYVIAKYTENVQVIEPQFSSAALNVPTPPPGTPVLTALTTLNVREGPGTVYAIVGQLEQGQVAEAVGRSADGKWLAIRVSSLPDGVGWVIANYVTVENVENLPVIK